MSWRQFKPQIFQPNIELLGKNLMLDEFHQHYSIFHFSSCFSFYLSTFSLSAFLSLSIFFLFLFLSFHFFSFYLSQSFHFSKFSYFPLSLFPSFPLSLFPSFPLSLFPSFPAVNIYKTLFCVIYATHNKLVCFYL
jgi:hypothetical protein